MEAEVLKYGWLIVLSLVQIVFALLKMLEKRNSKKNGDVGNPINLDRFYQAFKDFKETQEKWNDRIEGEINDLEKMRHPGK